MRLTADRLTRPQHLAKVLGVLREIRPAAEWGATSNVMRRETAVIAKIGGERYGIALTDIDQEGAAEVAATIARSFDARIPAVGK